MPHRAEPRGYTKTSDYWDRPTLADMIREHAADMTYAELRDAALEAGYSINSFYQTMSNLRSEDELLDPDWTAGG